MDQDKLNRDIQVEQERIRSVYRGLVKSEKWRQDYKPINQVLLFKQYLRDFQLFNILLSLGYSDLGGLAILDVGCGVGGTLSNLARWGASPCRLYGVDISSERLKSARSLCPPSTHLILGNSALLPFADSAFDIVLQSYTISASHNPAVRQQLADEMVRVLKFGGLLIHEDIGHTKVNPDDPYGGLGISSYQISSLYGSSFLIAIKPLYFGRMLRILLNELLSLAGWLADKMPFLSPSYLAVLRKTEDGGTAK